MMPTRRLLLPLAAAAGLALAAPALGAEPTVWINEIHYDNAGTDAAEGIELAGPANTNLSGWALHLYSGFDGHVYASVPLGGIVPAQQENFGTNWFSVPGLQNGAPDGIALSDGHGQLVQFLSYEGAVVASDGLASGSPSVPIGPFEHPSTSPGLSLQLVGTGTRSSDFTWSSAKTASAGQVNHGQRFDGSADPAGNGAAPSPTAGQEVLTVAERSRFPILRLRPRIDVSHANSRLGAIRYVIRAPSIARFAIQRIRSGRRANGRCEAVPPAGFRASSCRRIGPILGTLEQHAVGGRNVLPFGGRVRGRPLLPGLYRLLASADGVTRRATFRILH
jgi:hypothetical protein